MIFHHLNRSLCFLKVDEGLISLRYNQSHNNDTLKQSVFLVYLHLNIRKG